MVYAPVATRPPPPPLESEASEVVSRHSYSGLAQSDSRRAVTSCAPRRVETPSPDGPADIATFWTRTGKPVCVPRDVALPVVLLPDRRNPLHRRTGTQLAAGPSQVCISPSEASRTDTVQGQGGRGADPARGAILAHPDLVPRADAPRDSPSLANSSEEGSTASETGHPVTPTSRPLETSCLVPGWDAEVLGDLPQEGVYTIKNSTQNLLDYNLQLDGCTVTSSTVKNLGVILDSNLSFENHISNVAKTAFFHLRNISKLRNMLSVSDAEKLVHAFMTSRLDYCNALLGGCPASSINKLQIVQNAAARVLTRSRKYDHITPILQSLHWLPIKFRISYKILLLAYKVPK